MRERGSWIQLPENRAAQQAVECVLECLQQRRAGRRTINPLFVHGPTGTGKTRLMNLLVAELTQGLPDAIVGMLPASDLDDSDESLHTLKQADLVILEDLHHLHPRAMELLVSLIDRCLVRHRQLVLTAHEGPARLTRLPVRVTSRLAQGLVVAMETLGPDSRGRFLRQSWPTLADEVIGWLVQHTAGSLRQLEGALTRLETLHTALGRSPTLEEIQDAFQTDADSRRLTLERIVDRVGRYFHVPAVQVRSTSRSRQVLLPRQVSMYLARQLTPLSLEQIGAYFGGRDHTTVLHACRKIEQTIDQDASLSGVVRELQADLA